MSKPLPSQEQEFKFKVFPKETVEERELRWDAQIMTLLEQGLTVQGIGPDGDYPKRYDFNEDGQMTFEEWMRDNVDSPFFEVYDVVRLPGIAGLVREVPGDVLEIPVIHRQIPLCGFGTRKEHMTA